MNNKNVEFHYDKIGVASCTIKYDGKTFTAYARCHPEDSDMMNEYTGCNIAYRRAAIILYRYRRDELKQSLKALNQLYYTMRHSKKFNEKSYENIMLQRQINLIKDDLATIKELLINERQNLIEYINSKDEFYKSIRANRKTKGSNN